MDKTVHGQKDTWAKGTWTKRYMDKKVHGQKGTWTKRYMDKKVNGQKGTWTKRYMDKKVHGQKGSAPSNISSLKNDFFCFGFSQRKQS
jgi:hypothetical protein